MIPGWGSALGRGIDYPLQNSWASLEAQAVKNRPVTQETWVWSLGWEDALEEGRATHSHILAWRTWQATVHGIAKSRPGLSDKQHIVFISGGSDA